MKRLVLFVVAVMLGFSFSAMADTTYTNNETYSNSCNVDVLNVTSGNRAASMVVAPNEYECVAGTYLPADATECETCPAGYACSGGTYTYNADDDQGKTQCANKTYSEAGSASCTACPDPNTHKRTSFPAEYHDVATFSAYVEASGDRTSVSQCQAFSDIHSNAGSLYDRTTYNTATEKYDIVKGNLLWHTVNPGYYLTDKKSCGSYAYYKQAIECPAGSYCPGKSAVLCDSSNVATVHTTTFGLETCPEGYTSSATGAKAITECYKSCTTSNVSHSSTVTGNDYYGDGYDTCAATACDTGYSVAEEININNTVGQDWSSAMEYGYINNGGTYVDGVGSKGQSYYGISGNNSFALDFGNKGVVTGHGRCSHQTGTGLWNGADSADDITKVAELTDETNPDTGGQYCWCSVDGYKPHNGDLYNVQSMWVYRNFGGSAASCALYCAMNCADLMLNRSIFRSAILGTIPVIYATCAANSITINWDDGAGGTHESNTCTYDGALTTPETAPTKRGYHFTGWTFE